MARGTIDSGITHGNGKSFIRHRKRSWRYPSRIHLGCVILQLLLWTTTGGLVTASNRGFLRRPQSFVRISSLRGGSSEEVIDALFQDHVHQDQDRDRDGDQEEGPETFTGTDEDDEQDTEEDDKNELYEAYNMLHSLAQTFHKPFDSPAVIVVGHQSSGKSALLEALMGFQFNHVGGGTKTRRPICLRMQYDPDCVQPQCYLFGNPASLQEIQDYIASENRRLERDPKRSFDATEIHLCVKYKYCPNMILIDTPGLIASSPLSNRQTPAAGDAGGSTAAQRALQRSAREAEQLVRTKLAIPDYIILCVEDTVDWKHGSVTRDMIGRWREHSSDFASDWWKRTIVVNTKLDTKLPQFANPQDLWDFLQAPLLRELYPTLLGGPFFTSVPPGRVDGVGGATSASPAFSFSTDEDFVKACSQVELTDATIVERRLLRRSSGDDDSSTAAKQDAMRGRIGISQLRTFLERHVEDCYRRNVSKIIPLLKREREVLENKLRQVDEELEALSAPRLKQSADDFCDALCAALREAIRGTVAVSPSDFGETLNEEHKSAALGEDSASFHEIPGSPLDIAASSWEYLLRSEIGDDVQHRLFGGSQYSRTLHEFQLAAFHLRLPTVTEDEIANAVGVGDVHDGANYLRAACVVALEKARTCFDPLLDALQSRLVHVMGERLWPVCEAMLDNTSSKGRRRWFYGFDYATLGIDEQSHWENAVEANATSVSAEITESAQFRVAIRTIYESFVEQCAESAMRRCRDDVTALTSFVTWDSHDSMRSVSARHPLPGQAEVLSVYQLAIQAAKRGGATMWEEGDSTQDDGLTEMDENTVAETAEKTVTPASDMDVPELLEEMARSRDGGRTAEVVGAIIQHIVARWRECFGRSTVTKFNCFFLLPFVEEFHRYLRAEVQRLYDEGGGDDGESKEGIGEESSQRQPPHEENGLTDIFDVKVWRQTLYDQREQILRECAANDELREKFLGVQRLMAARKGTTTPLSRESA